MQLDSLQRHFMILQPLLIRHVALETLSSLRLRMGGETAKSPLFYTLFPLLSALGLVPYACHSSLLLSQSKHSIRQS